MADRAARADGRMIEKLLMKLGARDTVTPQEAAALRASIGTVKEAPADKTIIRADEDIGESTLLIDGLMCRYKDLKNGSRQISELHVPGDFVDLHSFTLKRLDHSIMTLTPCRFALVPHDRLEAISEQFPHLTRLLWFSTNLDAAIHREWVLSLGRRTALARTAHLLCELYFRFRIVGMTDGSSYRLPLTQTDLAECLGLTPVHVNRTLKALRDRGLVTFRQGLVTIDNLTGLEKVAEFTTGYLSLQHRPR